MSKQIKGYNLESISFREFFKDIKIVENLISYNFDSDKKCHRIDSSKDLFEFSVENDIF